MTATRDIYWDVIKGIAITLMVLGHTIEYGSGMEFRETVAYFDSRLFQWIYAFHMPLFMFVSGYFFNKSIAHHRTKELVIGKLTGVGIPILSFALLTFILFRFDMSGGFGAVLLRFGKTLIGTLWFLWAILLCSFVVLLVNKLFSDSMLAYIVIWIAVLFIPGEWSAPHIFMYPYFLFGYFSCKYQLMDWISRYPAAVAVISFALFFIMMQNYGSQHLVYTTGTYLMGANGTVAQLKIDIFRWCVGFAGVFAVLGVIKSLERIKCLSGTFNLFSFLGRKSMGIYCFNALICAVYFHFTKDLLCPSVLLWIVGAVVMLAAGTVATIVCEMCKPLRLLFLGGR